MNMAWTKPHSVRCYINTEKGKRKKREICPCYRSHPCAEATGGDSHVSLLWKNDPKMYQLCSSTISYHSPYWDIPISFIFLSHAPCIPCYAVAMSTAYGKVSGRIWVLLVELDGWWWPLGAVVFLQAHPLSTCWMKEMSLFMEWAAVF